MVVWKLYYDGGCNLCHASKLRAERWAEKAGQPLDVDILQGPDAIAKGYREAMVLEADRVYVGADAWLKLMDVAPWYLRWIGLMQHTTPTRWLATRLYGIVARLRYRLFGRRSCPIPRAKA